MTKRASTYPISRQVSRREERAKVKVERQLLAGRQPLPSRYQPSARPRSAYMPHDGGRRFAIDRAGRA